jgi:hypothetical protein
VCVRSLFLLYAIHRFYLPARTVLATHAAYIPFDGYTHLLNRRFEEAISEFFASFP